MRADMVIEGETGGVLVAPEDLGWFEHGGLNVTVLVIDAPTDPAMEQLDPNGA
jgi:hypothetical protein